MTTDASRVAPHLFHFLFRDVPLDGFANREPIRSRYKANLQLHFQPQVARWLQDVVMGGADTVGVIPVTEAYDDLFKPFFKTYCQNGEQRVECQEFLMCLCHWAGVQPAARAIATTVNPSAASRPRIRELLGDNRVWWEPYRAPVLSDSLLLPSPPPPPPPAPPCGPHSLPLGRGCCDVCGSDHCAFRDMFDVTPGGELLEQDDADLMPMVLALGRPIVYSPRVTLLLAMGPEQVDAHLADAVARAKAVRANDVLAFPFDRLGCRFAQQMRFRCGMFAWLEVNDLCVVVFSRFIKF